jgi:hypothetical protein
MTWIMAKYQWRTAVGRSLVKWLNEIAIESEINERKYAAYKAENIRLAWRSYMLMGAWRKMKYAAKPAK